MIYKNFEIYNVAEIIENSDGSISWIRLPQKVYTKLESEQGKSMAVNSTGVELRFVLNGDQAVIRLATKSDDGIFHIYRGSVQGTWEDHEVEKVVNTDIKEYVIKRSENLDKLHAVTKKCGYPFDPEVIRVVFDRGDFKLFDITGDILLPQKGQLPQKKLMSYGSSITHGSNSIDRSHSWVSVLAHNLGIDARNLGMAGSCRMEPEVIDYIASEGEKGNWDIATLELGINVLDFDDEKIFSRAENTISQVAGRNPDKPVFVISPFYHYEDDFNPDDRAKVWRRILEQTTSKLNLPNVTYINGMDILDNCSYMSADEVHPNIYGVQKIAEKLTEIIGEKSYRNQS